MRRKWYNLNTWPLGWVFVFGTWLSFLICAPFMHYATIQPLPWVLCFKTCGWVCLVTSPFFWLMGWMADHSNKENAWKWSGASDVERAYLKSLESGIKEAAKEIASGKKS